MTARAAARALVQGRADGGIAVPLALPTAARIRERDWQDFLEDPTQLANGIRDLHQAVAPGGLVVSDAATLLEQADAGLASGPHARAVIEAVGRLRSSLGDEVALVAPLPGAARLAAAGVTSPRDAVQELGKELLGAGADVLLVLDEGSPDPGLSTLANIARFHQGGVAAVGAAVSAPLVPARELPLDDPADGDGLIVTEGIVPRETDITVLEDWIDTVQGG